MRRSPLPLLDGYQAGILLEVVKDLLYEAYVRKGRLQQAIMVRRFFLDETGTHSRRRCNAASVPLSRRSAARCGTGASSRCTPRRPRGRQEFCSVAERALRVRHGDGDAAVGVASAPRCRTGVPLGLAG